MIKSPKHFYYITKETRASLDTLISSIDKFYYQKKKIKLDSFGNPKVEKGEAQFRILTPSTGKLKKLQKKLCNKIFINILLPECAYGSIKGKSNITNALKHKGKKFKFLLDLSDFFPSISSKVVYQSLMNEGFSPDIARLVTRLTTFKNQLPQGAPTSPYIANIVFKQVDFQILKLVQDHQITYTRFVDDLTFSSQSNFDQLHSAIVKIINNNGYRLSRNKTFATTGKVNITGVKVGNNTVGITDAFREKLSSEKLSIPSREGCLVYRDQILKHNNKTINN
jgi:RNA-directed DNA polymerase